MVGGVVIDEPDNRYVAVDRRSAPRVAQLPKFCLGPGKYRHPTAPHDRPHSLSIARTSGASWRIHSPLDWQVTHI